MADGDVNVAIIGAGPAGLAVGGALAGRGIQATLFEREETAARWRCHYERLHLHTIRSLSGLPGGGMPRRYGRYVARGDVVRYLDRYREQHSLDVRSGVLVEGIDRVDGGYRVKTASSSFSARHVVVATGYNHTPILPAWDGADRRCDPARVGISQRSAIP